MGHEAPAVPVSRDWVHRVDPTAAALLSLAYVVDPDNRPFEGPDLIRADPGSALAGLRPWRFGGPTLTGYLEITMDAWVHLKDHGWLSPAAEMVDEEFWPSYDWLRWRMVHRVPGYSGRYPMWLWPALKHTLRQQLDHTPGSVVLSVAIPAAKVLLSSFGAWHSVLSCGPTLLGVCLICGQCACQDETHLDLEAEFAAFGQLVPPLQTDPANAQWTLATATDIHTITRSWDEMFNRRWFGTWPVQGVVEILESSWVTRAVRIG